MITESPLKASNITGEKDKKEEEYINSSVTKPYALATLDGTLMLVKNEVILWYLKLFYDYIL